MSFPTRMHPIKIYSVSETKGTFYNIQKNLNLVMDTFASISYLRGTEENSNSGVEYNLADVIFKIRYQFRLHETYVILYNGDYYNILYIDTRFVPFKHNLIRGRKSNLFK
jgi:head-tail adaptor